MYLYKLMLSFLAVSTAWAEELTLIPPGNPGNKFIRALNSSLVITCMVHEDSRDQLSSLDWYDNNNALVSKRSGSDPIRVYVEEDGDFLKKIYITALKRFDVGNYTCKASIGGSIREKSVELVFYKDITFDNAPVIQYPAVNTDALIRCEVSGSPVPEVTWRYNGNRLHLGDRYVKEEKGLRIHSITRLDDGEYTCRAEVEKDGRYDERKIQVTVHIPPQITKNLTNSEGVHGSDLNLSCRGSGLPAPRYKFFKDNSEVVKVSDRINIEETVGELYFSPLNKQDEGIYTCMAWNDVGNATTVGQLLVLVSPLVYNLSNVGQSKEGQTAEIKCRTIGDPVPEISFHRTDRNIDYQVGVNDSRISVRKSSPSELVLSIVNLEPRDTGNYTCKVQSLVGSDTASTPLVVQYKPRFLENHARVEYIWFGRIRNVTCRASGEPRASFKWLRSGQNLNTNDTFKIFDMGDSSIMEVHVKETDQGWIYGTYTCKAQNTLGHTEIRMDLRRATVPDAPQSVKEVASFPTMLILQAEVPYEDGGMKVIGYRIEYDDKVKDFHDGDKMEINDLKPSTVYLFKVRAKNEVGFGTPYEISISTVPVRVPYPIEITSDPAGQDPYEYVVTWKSPIDGGLPIISYKISYRKVSVEINSFNISQPLKDWIIIFTSDDLTMQHYKLEELDHMSHYELEIRTENEMGWSEPNKQFVFSTVKDLLATTTTTTTSTTTTTTTTTPSSSSSLSTTAVKIDLTSTRPASIGLSSELLDIDELSTNNITVPGVESKPVQTKDQLSVGSVVAIVVFVLIFFFVIVDASCYLMNGCGFTMLVCVHVFGREKRPVRDRRGQNEGECEKKPFDDVTRETEPLTAGAYYSKGNEHELKISLNSEVECNLVNDNSSTRVDLATSQTTNESENNVGIHSDHQNNEDLSP